MMYVLTSVNDPEQFVPSDLALEKGFVFIERQPDEDGFADDMVLRDKPPETGVGGIMPVITHHPVIIHLEGVSMAFLTVNEYLIAVDLQVIMFINADDPLIKADVSGIDGDRFAALRDD